MATTELLPAFEVHPYEGTYKVTVMRSVKGDDGKHREFVKDVEEREGGFTVYFPQGHSIHVADEGGLRELGLIDEPDLVDMMSGEVAPKGYNSTLQRRVDAKTRNVRK